VIKEPAQRNTGSGPPFEDWYARAAIHGQAPKVALTPPTTLVFLAELLPHNSAVGSLLILLAKLEVVGCGGLTSDFGFTAGVVTESESDVK